MKRLVRASYNVKSSQTLEQLVGLETDTIKLGRGLSGGYELRFFDDRGLHIPGSCVRDPAEIVKVLRRYGYDVTDSDVTAATSGLGASHERILLKSIKECIGWSIDDEETEAEAIQSVKDRILDGDDFMSSWPETMQVSIYDNNRLNSDWVMDKARELYKKLSNN